MRMYKGLIHVSELGYNTPDNAMNIVELGQIVLVKILQGDKDRQRVSMSKRLLPFGKQ